MCMTHNLNFSRLSFWSYGQSSHFNVISMERSKVYYREEGGGFFLNPSHVNIVNPKANSQPKIGFICTNHLHFLVCACDLFVRCPWLSHHSSPIPKPPRAFLTPQVHKAREHTLVYILLQLWDQQNVYPWYYLTSLRTCHLNIWLSCSHNLILNFHNVFEHNKCWIFCEDFQFWCHV
jgi:hypothetical protein